jgi:cell division protein FtsI/penicillin-binding protein 2
MGSARDSFATAIERRMKIVLLFFLVGILALIGRLFTLQVVYHREYVELASKQHRLVQNLSPERGTIFVQDKNGTQIPLALNRIEKTLVASPVQIKDPTEAAEIISKELNLDHKSMLEKLSRPGDSYEIIVRRLDSEKAEQIYDKLPDGFFFEEERRRIYPQDSLGARLVGFVSVEEQEEEGRYGLERRYNEDLSGKKGILEGTKDAAGYLVALGRRIVNPPQNGSNLVLTIDYNIQVKAEEVLKQVARRWSPMSGTLLVLEPKTGRVLAEAAYPSFDLNEFSKVKDYSTFLNPLVESIYELGSVMKPVTMAAALEEKVIDPTSTYVDTGEVKIGGYTIKNFDLKAHQTQTMSQVIEKSLNTGMVHVSRLLGQERQLEYFKKFGFGDKVGIDLPGELTGDISNLDERRDIDYATASFGQGIAVTPIQLASAIAAVANDGKLMKPFVVQEIVDDSGNTFKVEPEVRREVISPETAEKLTKMLVSAVKNGFENRAGVKGYFVAGKTGTAQIPKTDSRGYSDKVIHSFVGYAPAFDPRFLIYIQLNEPTGNRFAANTLTPAFHDLAEYILNYYEVPPDEK